MLIHNQMCACASKELHTDRNTLLTHKRKEEKINPQNIHVYDSPKSQHKRNSPLCT